MNFIPNRLIFRKSPDAGLSGSAEAIQPKQCKNLGELAEKIDDSIVGTDKELELKLKHARIKAECSDNPDKWPYFGNQQDVEKMKIPKVLKQLNKLITEAKLLQTQIVLSGGDTHFVFDYKGKEVMYKYREGEGASMDFCIGGECNDINFSFTTSGESSSYKLGAEYGTEKYQNINLIANPAKANETKRGLEFVIAGMKESINKPPVYQELINSPDVRKNGGLNIRNENADVIGKIPLGSRVQVTPFRFSPYKIGRTSKYVFVYYVDGDRSIKSGWVKKDYLIGSAEKKETERMRIKKTEVIKKNGGLNLRSNPDTYSKVFGKIPAGTVVDIIRKATIKNSLWAEVKYTDSSGREKSGWACVSQQGEEYMMAVNE